MTDTPIRPPFAPYIWSADNILYLESPGPNGKTHLLRFPLNVFGMTQIVNMLKARSHESRIGEPGDLTQHQTDDEIRRLLKGFPDSKVKRPNKLPMNPERQGIVKDVLRRLGL